MVGTETDMTEHPNDILRASRIPDRLDRRRPGRGRATALAEALDLPLARVPAPHPARERRDRWPATRPPHVPTRIETLRWAAEQVAAARRGSALGAATEDEEAVLRASRDGRLIEVPTKASKRRIVLERIALEFEPGSGTTSAR